MQRLYTKDATGIAPNGRWFAGDINALQDAVAAQTDFTQQISLGSLAIGDGSIQLVKFGTGESRMTSAFRTDGVVRALGGFFAGTFTTTARNAIPAGATPNQRPYGLVILNTTTNRFEWNAGTDAAPTWQPLGADGTGAFAKAPTRTILTAVGTGTYNTPAGCRAIFVECVAGGGAGGAAQTGSTGGVDATGSGGNGGFYAAKLIQSPATSYAFTVGAGGTGAGQTSGGNTSFGASAVVAVGGSVGTGMGAGVGPPFVNGPQGLGGGSVGDLVIPGEQGEPGMAISTAFYWGGRGGRAAGPYGGPGGARAVGINGTVVGGNSGSNYGGAGGGAAEGQFGGGPMNGGNGAQGIIVVTEYY